MSNHFGSQGERQLQKKYGTEESAEAFYSHQVVDFLTEEMMSFISQQEMMFIATADRDGNCDSSFRHGEKGFIKVINSKKLIYPEYRGNGVVASLGNVVENPHIGLLIIDFYEKGIGLHINGMAVICDICEIGGMISDSHIKTALNEDKHAQRWVIIEVEEAYIHCSKHIPILEKRQANIEWGERSKSGDPFKVKQHKK